MWVLIHTLIKLKLDGEAMRITPFSSNKRRRFSTPLKNEVSHGVKSSKLSNQWPEKLPQDSLRVANSHVHIQIVFILNRLHTHYPSLLFTNEFDSCLESVHTAQLRLVREKLEMEMKTMRKKESHQQS